MSLCISNLCCHNGGEWNFVRGNQSTDKQCQDNPKSHCQLVNETTFLVDLLISALLSLKVGGATLESKYEVTRLNVRKIGV